MTVQNEINDFDVIFLGQYKTHRGGEGAGRVGMRGRKAHIYPNRLKKLPGAVG